MDFEINYADEPKVLPPDREIAPTPEEQKAYIEVAEKLYKESAPSVGRVLTEKGSGSAFFVEDDALVTDAHVVQDASFHRVKTTDGKLYPARIEKIDDINDLAYLRLEGVEEGKYKPFKLQNSSPNSAQAFALGHPKGSLDVVISAGRIQAKGTQLDFNCSTRNRKTMDEYRDHLNRMDDMLNEMAGLLGKDRQSTQLPTCEEKWNARVNALPLEERVDGEYWLKAPTLRGLVEIHPGNSGGPLIDSTGSVIGVSRMIESIDPASSSFAPVEVVNDFLNTPEQKFKFNYGYENSSLTANLVKHAPFTSAAIGGTTVAISTAAVRRAPRLAALGGVGFGLMNLTSDLEERQYLIAPRARMQNSVEIGTDTVSIGGSALTLARRHRRLGIAIAAIGFASRFASEFIPTELKLESIERQDGSLRPPFTSKKLGVK